MQYMTRCIFEYYSVKDSKSTIKDLSGPITHYNFGYDIFINLN